MPFTVLVRKASARRLTPSFPIRLLSSLSMVSVYVKSEDTKELNNDKHMLTE